MSSTGPIELTVTEAVAFGRQFAAAVDGTMVKVDALAALLTSPDGSKPPTSSVISPSATSLYVRCMLRDPDPS